MSEIAILGCGMAGLGAAWRLAEEDRAATVYDKNAYPGGHTASFRDPSGFVFDDGPHISFTRNERVQGLLAESVAGEFEILQAQVDNYWRGHRIKHPAQCNLHGLPFDLVARVLEDFIAVQDEDSGEVESYEDWLIASFGRTFAETFPMEYGRKYHTVEARGMSTDWLGPRLYRPKLEEVLAGALADRPRGLSRYRPPPHRLGQPRALLPAGGRTAHLPADEGHGRPRAKRRRGPASRARALRLGQGPSREPDDRRHDS